MHTLLLTPTDTLFFRDGRPMEGSLAGHTASWPAPHIVSHALHAALHRAGVASHKHHTGNYRTRDYSNDSAREQLYGSLKTAGPFPVFKDKNGTLHWYFPAPADLFKTDNVVKIGVAPVKSGNPSSLPAPLTHALAATLPPAKDSSPGQWLRADAFADYLRGAPVPAGAFVSDSEIGATEAAIGIGIDSGTGAQDGERFYSAQYLRLRDGWHLGILAEADDKDAGDLIANLLATETHLILGGQQRTCAITPAGTAATDTRITNPLDALAGTSEASTKRSGVSEAPTGTGGTSSSATSDGTGKHRLKWTLLTPAIFPELLHPDGSRKHPGGWLPNWIAEKDGIVPATGKTYKAGAVLLPQTIKRNSGEPRAKWRTRVQAAGAINARLIAAKIGNAIPVTGWDLLEKSPKPTLLAVPAGSIYYFECDDAESAKQLAAALTPPNRRSTLLGEKGYGLGLCAPWQDAGTAQSSPSGGVHAANT